MNRIKDWWYDHKESVGGLLIVIMPLTVLVCLITVTASVMEEYGRRNEQMEFSGWEKLTGNPKRLTPEEFKALRRGGLIP